jgi:hypothetical protein
MYSHSKPDNKYYYGLAILLLGLGLTLSANANSKSYRVSLIIFQQLSSDKSQEDWSPAQHFTKPARALSLGQQISFTKGVGLTRAYQSLAASRHYRVLLRGRWQQQLKHPNRARPVYLTTPGDDINGQVSGIITLSRAGPLYLQAKLQINQQVNDKLISSPIEVSTKITRNKLYYLDNPLFGVLIQVS